MAKKVVEDALIVHKTEVVFYDKFEERHYRLNANNIKKVIYDYAILKTFFGLKKELVERIVFTVDDPDIPEELVVYEFEEPNFRRFRGGLRTFLEDNKIAVEIKDVEGNITNN
ncbi:MAG: hypothetical protein J6D09_09175 [Clostridia bacterium]|nr:hypothetical protein [Clostridia bacterium]